MEQRLRLRRTGRTDGWYGDYRCDDGQRTDGTTVAMTDDNAVTDYDGLMER